MLFLLSQLDSFGHWDRSFVGGGVTVCLPPPFWNPARRLLAGFYHQVAWRSGLVTLQARGVVVGSLVDCPILDSFPCCTSASLTVMSKGMAIYFIQAMVYVVFLLFTILLSFLDLQLKTRLLSYRDD